MREHNFAFIDIETTGLDLLRHEIIEIGCVITTPNLSVLEELEIKIKPEHIEKADPVSLKVNRYNSDEWGNAVTLREALEILRVKTENCIMVGHNVAFDSSFLEYAFEKNDITNIMHYHRLDTVSVAWAKLHHDPGLEHFSLHEMCVRFGIKNEQAHRALSDARATFELYKKLMEL